MLRSGDMKCRGDHHRTRPGRESMPKNIVRAALLKIAIMLAGCVTTSQIVPAGADTYMVSAANDTCGNCTPPEIRASEQANAYCAKMGKSMSVKDTKDQTFDIGFGHRYTLTFMCK
jgi:hypothetical protein